MGFVDVVDYYDVADADRDGFGNDVDRYVFDPSEWADSDGDGIATVIQMPILTETVSSMQTTLSRMIQRRRSTVMAMVHPTHGTIMRQRRRLLPVI